MDGLFFVLKFCFPQITFGARFGTLETRKLPIRSLNMRIRKLTVTIFCLIVLLPSSPPILASRSPVHGQDAQVAREVLSLVPISVQMVDRAIAVSSKGWSEMSCLVFTIGLCAEPGILCSMDIFLTIAVTMMQLNAFSGNSVRYQIDIELPCMSS